jgi:hypothetical protein
VDEERDAGRHALQRVSLVERGRSVHPGQRGSGRTHAIRGRRPGAEHRVLLPDQRARRRRQRERVPGTPPAARSNFRLAHSGKGTLSPAVGDIGRTATARSWWERTAMRGPDGVDGDSDARPGE